MEKHVRGGWITHLLLHRFLQDFWRFKHANKRHSQSKRLHSKAKWRDERDTLAMAVVIEATITLESFINGYGSTSLTSLFDEYIERADLLSKCILIPRLAHNFDLTSNASLVIRLKRLLKVRNRFVHPKLIALSPNKEIQRKRSSIEHAHQNELLQAAMDSLLLVHDFAKAIFSHAADFGWAMAIEELTSKQLHANRFLPIIRYHGRSRLTRRSS